MRDASRLDLLRWQFELAWRLADEAHLPHITDESCLWAPAPGAWTVHRDETGTWRADWQVPEPEEGTTTIGWVSWHLIWWWSELLDRLHGRSPVGPTEATWPGSADGVRTALRRLHAEWATLLDGLTDDDLDAPFAWPWPEERPLAYALLWANAELMKNVAEIGSLRSRYQATSGA